MRESSTTQGDSSGKAAEKASMQQLYADARATARIYPATPLLQAPATDQLTAESHWRAICAELISARSSSRQLLD